MYKPGDLVVFRAAKVSDRPGRRAEAVSAAPRGEYYQYQVDKYWVVAAVEDAGQVRLRTRRGKEHVLSIQNPQLRPACWWERWFLRERFPKATEAH